LSLKNFTIFPSALPYVSVEKNTYTPKNTPLVINLNSTIEPQDKAIAYVKGNDIFYVNTATSAINSLIIGITDKPDTYIGENFRFDTSGSIVYDSNIRAIPIILNKLGAYKDKMKAPDSMGFALPFSDNKDDQTVTFGGTSIGNAFKTKIYDTTGNPYTITLKGNSSPLCVNYGWKLSAAITIKCLTESDPYKNRSQGYIITFDPKSNTDLPTGTFYGQVIMQGIDFNSQTKVQNISVNIKITNTSSGYAFVTNFSKNAVSICNIESNSNLSNCIDSSTAKLNSPFGVTTNNNYAYVTNVGDNSVTVCKIVSSIKSGKEPGIKLSSCVDSGAKMGSFSVPGEIITYNNYAYVANKGNNTVTFCKININNGTLSGCVAKSDPVFSSPVGVAINKSGNNISYLYISNYDNNKISICNIDSSSGVLTNCVDSGSGMLAGQLIGAAVSNNFAYIVSNANSIIKLCSIDSKNGSLSNCDDSGAGQVFPSPTAIVTQSGYAYVASLTGVVKICKIDSMSGKLSNCEDSGVDKKFNQSYGITTLFQYK
jgi:hypothetical protein